MALSGGTSLETLPLIAALSREVRERVLSSANIHNAAPGTVLFHEGEVPESVHVLLSGLVEISRLDGGRHCGVMMFTAGDVFMPAATLFSEPYLASGRALTASSILLLDAALIREQANSNPQFALRLCQIVSGHWRMAVRHILDLKCRSAPQRLGAFLLKLADQNNSPTGAVLPMPKSHLAARVGMSAETLSRTLQVLAENGLHLRGKRILVKDREKLETFCGPDPYPDREETSLGVYAL